MEWQFRTDQPIYTQLVGQMELALCVGKYAPGEKFPSVRELASEAGVNPNTMQRALTELERAQLLITRRTSGRYVTEDTAMLEQVKQTLAGQRVAEFLAAMSGLGYRKEQVLELIRREAEKEE